MPCTTRRCRLASRAFTQRKQEPLAPKPPLPKKPRKDRAENIRRVAKYQQLLDEYEQALCAHNVEHKELMPERKRATDRRSRPEDDGQRAAKRRRVRVAEQRRELNFQVIVPVGRKQAPMSGLITWDKRKRTE